MTMGLTIEDDVRTGAEGSASDEAQPIEAKAKRTPRRPS
jgi:hypothetical protein